MQIHNLKQGSQDWFSVRKGKFTASKAHTVSVGGKGLETLCLEKTAELLSSAMTESYTNEAIEHGKLMESEARSIYELEKDVEVKEVGFCEYSEFIGCSPDGLVGDDGLIEIKCPTDKVYTQYLIDREIKTEYFWQMQMQMLITCRSWCDYVVYNSNFEKSIIIERVFASEECFDKLKSGFAKGIETIKNNLEKING